MNRALPLQAAAAAACLAGGVATAGVEYTLTRIQGPPGALSVVPWGVNDGGAVVGWVILPQQPVQAFFWTPAGGMTVLPPPPGEDATIARDVTNGGLVVGGYEFGPGWTHEGNTYNVLPLFEGAFSADALGSNDLGDAAGTVNSSALLSFQSFFYDGQLDEMVPVAPWPSRAYDVNGARQVTGSASLSAFRWTPDGGLQSLGPLNGTYSSTAGFAINEAGDVAGGAGDPTTSNDSRAFIYTDEGGMQMIPPVGLVNRAQGINDHRVVVGNSEHAGGGDLGWVWTADTGSRALTNLIDPAENTAIVTAHDVSNLGHVTGLAFDNNVADWAGYLLTPVSMIPGDLDGDGLVDILDFLGLLAQWGPCPAAPAACTADVDGDGAVGISDFLILLANWSAS